MEGRGAGLPAKARGPAAVRRGPKADFVLCWWVCRGWGPSRGRQRGLPNPVCGVISRRGPQRRGAALYGPQHPKLGQLPAFPVCYYLTAGAG